MRVSYLMTMGFACISYLALGFAPTQVSAQLVRRQRPAVNPQPASDPAQPVPTLAGILSQLTESKDHGRNRREPVGV